MSDCGCGSSDGNCTDNLNSNEKNAQLTGNISYDGSAISCDDNSSIDISTNEGLNSIIQKILSNLCTVGNGGSGIIALNTNVAVSGTGAPKVEEVTRVVLGVGEVKANEGFRVKASGTFVTVAAASGLDFTVNFVAEDASAVTIATIPAGTVSIPQATVGARFLLDGEFYLTGTNIYYNFEFKSEDDALLAVLNGTSATPDITTVACGVSFTVGVNDVADSTVVMTSSVERLR